MGKPCWLAFVLAVLITGTSLVHAEVATVRLKLAPKAAAQEVAARTGTVLSCQNGEGVVRFDLSCVPQNAKVYRADLHLSRSADLSGKDDNALIDTEVFPLLQEFKEGDAPKPEGKPLAIRGPWCDRLDVTEAVTAWAAGKPNGGFFVKALPLWNPEATFLEVLYEGTPQKVPPAATGLRALHRAGQTFITWKEIKDVVGEDNVKWGALRRVRDDMAKGPQVRYCIYRSAQPITAKNLAQAQWIATVEPLSCWNINGRNIERPIDEFVQQYALNHGQWNPFWSGDVDGKFGLDCQIDRFVIEDGGQPLPRASGLYVHTPAEKGKAYYAVATAVDGVQNTLEFSVANSAKEPVEETPREPEPVLQGKLPQRPYNNYDEARFHYVQWTAPPLGNLPSQYYNWSVAVPLELEKSVPLELSLHREGLAYYRTQYRIEQNSVVLTPYDFPVNTAWYGYHESLGTLKSYKQGAIHNYTERRLLAFIDWAAGKWPIDRNRILVTAMRGYSCSGALHLAYRHPKVFNMVLVGYAFADYKQALLVDGKTEKKGTIPDIERLWGRIEWDLKTDEGKSVWDENNITKRIQDAPAGTEWPYLTLAGRYFKQSLREFFDALLTKGQPVMTNFNMWGGRFIPVTTTGNWSGMVQEDIRKNLSLPAFRGAEAEQLKKDAKQYATALNAAFRWDTADIVDQAKRYEITLRCAGRGAVVADVTLRRLQQFKVEPGKSYAWEFDLPVADKKGEPQKGEITVGDNGLLTVPGLKIPDSGARLVVTAK